MKVLNLNLQPYKGGEGDEVTSSPIVLDFTSAFGPQVETGLRKAGVSAIRNADAVNLPVQAHAAAIAAAMIYGVTGALPRVPVLDPTAGWALCGEFYSWGQRQAARAARRGATGETTAKYLVVNYAHPIAPEVVGQMAAALGVAEDELEVRNVRTQLDVHGDLGAQFAALVDQADVGDWETQRVAVNPPTMGLAGLGVLAEIHGRRGSFPPVLSIREPERGAGFRLMEVMNLNQAAEDGRKFASEADTASAPVLVPRELLQRTITELAELHARALSAGHELVGDKGATNALIAELVSLVRS